MLFLLNSIVYAQATEDEIKNFKRNRKCLSKEEYEYRNMLTTSMLIVQAALDRKESRGAHSRSDYKQQDAIVKHSITTKNVNKELSLC